jgi:hypothetical protein
MKRYTRAKILPPIYRLGDHPVLKDMVVSTLIEPCISTMKNGAGNEARTRDLNLGKVALYQLSYSRPKQTRNCRAVTLRVKKKSVKSAAKALN